MKNFTIFNKVFACRMFVVSMLIFNIAQAGNTAQSKDKQIKQETNVLIARYQDLISTLGRKIAEDQRLLKMDLDWAIRQRNASVAGSNVVNLLNERIALINQQLKHLKIIQDALVYDERRSRGLFH